MRQRRPVLLAGAGLVISLAGCAKAEIGEAEFTAFRQESQEQLELLKKQQGLLNRKLNGMNERLNQLQESNNQLTLELRTYAAQPDTMKLTISSEVNRRFAAVVQNQEAVFDTVTAAFKARVTTMDEKTNLKLDEIQKEVVRRTAFVQFVAAKQDSVNRVFANRFDSRPWYQSIMGMWNDLEREQQPESP